MMTVENYGIKYKSGIHYVFIETPGECLRDLADRQKEYQNPESPMNWNINIINMIDEWL